MAAAAYTGLVKAVQRGSMIFLIVLDIHLEKQAIINFGWFKWAQRDCVEYTVFPFCTDNEPPATV